jgi:hypothetical protein
VSRATPSLTDDGTLAAADARWLHDTVRALRRAGEMLQDQLAASREECQVLRAERDRLDAECGRLERLYRIEVETGREMLRGMNVPPQS